MKRKGKQATLFKCYGTQSQQLKHLTKKEYVALRKLCHLSKNLYNLGCYNVRQHYFSEREYLTYQANYPLCKNDKNYKLLNSNMAQQILKEVDKSFSVILKLVKKENYQNIKLPSFLPKESYFNLIIGQIRIKENGMLDIPMSPAFKKIYGKISIKVPSNLLHKKIKEIKIVPIRNARFFLVHYIYEMEKYEGKLNKNNVLAIDTGVDNL